MAFKVRKVNWPGPKRLPIYIVHYCVCVCEQVICVPQEILRMLLHWIKDKAK